MWSTCQDAQVQVRPGNCERPIYGYTAKWARTVKTVEMDDAIQTLAESARGIHGEALVVTERGTPVDVLLPLVNADMETVSLSSNPQFLELIERSRLRLAEEGAGSPQAVRRQLGI